MEKTKNGLIAELHLANAEREMSKVQKMLWNCVDGFDHSIKKVLTKEQIDKMNTANDFALCEIERAQHALNGDVI